MDSSHGNFFVRSLYSGLEPGSSIVFQLGMIWNSKVPLKFLLGRPIG